MTGSSGTGSSEPSLGARFVDETDDYVLPRARPPPTAPTGTARRPRRPFNIGEDSDGSLFKTAGPTTQRQGQGQHRIYRALSDSMLGNRQFQVCETTSALLSTPAD